VALITIDLEEIKGFGLADVLVLCLLVALLAGLVVLGRSWGAPFMAVAHIDLSPWSLVGYSVLSLSRGFAGILISLVLTFWWGLWAAHSKRAERILLPLVDILQSIPVLGFMPGLVLAMVSLFPRSRIGLELAGILMLVTSQAWNMILAFYQSNTSIPRDLRDAADAAGLKGWRRFLSLELPAGAGPLVWNSMLSMAGGWFFLIASETFQLGAQDYRLPGVGSYMAVAMDQGNVAAMFYAILAMAIIVVAVDQLVWRPLLAFAFRFRLDERDNSVPPSSWMGDFLGRSLRMQRFIESMGRQAWNLVRRSFDNQVARPLLRPLRFGRRLARLERLEMAALALGTFLLAWMGWRLFSLLQGLTLREWAALWSQAGLTLMRIIAATVLGSLWAIPLGVRIGLEPRVARWAGPLIQITASFPAPMLFPAVLVLLMALGMDLNIGSTVLMMTATSWYILFNTIAGASAIPHEQREAWAAYGKRGWLRWKKFLLPALLPSLLVGWETAVGGAWNASIVTEYLHMHGQTYTASGLGSTINLATERGDFDLLTASVLVMVVVVVATNRLFWHRLYDLANRMQA
jgi:NitT/TauT family transport system permease protein